MTDTLRVLTYNVLFDRYDQHIVRTSERIPRLVEQLEAADADLIGLQEVQPPFLRALLDASWVQAAYAVTDAHDGATVQPYGQILLSRHPIVGAAIHHVRGDKRHLVADVHAAGGIVRVAVVHLSSNRHDDAVARRARELDRLRELLGDAPRVVVLGDVNQHEPVDLDLLDAWVAVHPGEPGPTWDPERNALVRQMYPGAIPQRLDRVLLRGLAVHGASLWGVDPGPLPPSDHHGVLCEIG